MFRNFILNWLHKKADDQPQYPGWQAVQNIQLLCDALPNQPRPEIEKLKADLEKEGKQVEILVYQKGKKPKTEVPPNTYYRKDLFLFFMPKKLFRQQFAKSADVLIDWTLSPRSANDFLVAGNNASLIIGIERTLPFYNLTIANHGNSAQAISNEILKYLKIINHG